MKKFYATLKIGALALLMVGHNVTVGADTQLYPNTVQLSTKTFDPRKKETCSLSFQPSQSTAAVVKIYNFLGEKVVTLFDGKLKRNSVQKMIWKGMDAAKKIVPPGIYYYTIVLENKETKMTYNPYPETQGHILSILEGGYDEKNNQIYFKLPQAAMVRVRINIKKGGPIMATPLDWTPLAADEYRFPWDGKDVSGLIDIKNHPERNIMVYAYSLADNSIIVAGEQAKADQLFVILDEAAMAKQEFPLNLPPDRYIHARKDPRLNRVVRIEVSFPNAKTTVNVPVLSNKAPIRVSIDPRDQWIAEMSRYELMFYIDTVVVFEDESGFAPFTYYLNTKDLTSGEHVLTVNLLTYDDHYATISKKIIIRHEDEKGT